MVSSNLNFVAVAALTLVVADCSSTKLAGVSPDKQQACQNERMAFHHASETLSGWAAPNPDAYELVIAAQVKDSMGRLTKLQQDAQTLDLTIAQLAADYRALAECWLGAGAVAVALPDADVSLAQLDAASVRQQEINLRTEVDHLLIGNPRLGQKVWRALSAPPVPTQPSIALGAGVIRAKPDLHAVQIATVRKGERIVAADDEPTAGWTAITLNDGSVAYVESDILKPVKPSPSAIAQAAAARLARDAGGDPVVALARQTRETLPQHRANFADLVATGRVPATAAPDGLADTSNSASQSVSLLDQRGSTRVE